MCTQFTSMLIHPISLAQLILFGIFSSSDDCTHMYTIIAQSILIGLLLLQCISTRKKICINICTLLSLIGSISALFMALNRMDNYITIIIYITFGVSLFNFHVYNIWTNNVNMQLNAINLFDEPLIQLEEVE